MPLRHCTILLVDPSETSRRLLRSILTGFHAEIVLEAQTLTDAKALLDQETITLALVNTDLGDEDGFDLLAHIRQHSLIAGPDCGHAPLPVVMIANRATAAHLKRAQTLGADSFVTKPILPMTLWKRITPIIAVTRAAGGTKASVFPPPPRPLPPGFSTSTRVPA